MPLSWNEIKSRAVRFSKDWKDAKREEAEAQTFLIDFLNIFGHDRKRVATFEHKVKKIDDRSGYIDLLWKGMLLVEMKSRGQDMQKAYSQAKEYCHGLKSADVPKLILICDFHHFHLYDEGVLTEFELPQLINHIKQFGAIAGYQQRTFKEQDPVNIEAAVLMGKLHDKLKAIGYEGHDLELYLVRLLFILFADDTNIFERGIFQDYIHQRTAEDGSDLAQHLDALFTILNTHESKRLKIIDEQLNAFPYINGKLFEERLPLAAFDSSMRQILVESGTLDWGRISPAIFGSLFQSVMNEKERRNLGAHYTSEKNILKVIKPLFLDELWDEFNNTFGNKTKLNKLHEKISKLRFLDPACGCGNFLIIAYRELRLLELEIVKKLLTTDDTTKLILLRINEYFLVDVDQFYGIEYEEFPSQIAQVAMWLMDHQMNMIASEAFGEYMPRIPLKKSPVILNGNALRVEWQSLIQSVPTESEQVWYNYIFGNPPFIGSKLMTPQQRKEITDNFYGTEGSGVLDYVCGWYKKAAHYMDKYATQCSFVSTNSITQGEQVGILWGELLIKHQLHIDFAHQTFKWSNEAKGNAGVYCVIIGLTKKEGRRKLYTYSDIKGDPLESLVGNINPYLVDGKDVILQRRQKPICNVPQIKFGNQPIDGGHLILSSQEYHVAIQQEPEIRLCLRKYIGSEEFINGGERYCLWLKDISPKVIRQSKFISDRLELVKQFRLNSDRAVTKNLAATPSQFAFISHDDTPYIIIPSVSSEKRSFIPIGFMSQDVIASNLCLVIPDAQIWHFGILTSSMHMTWVRYTCGRLESRYRYSNTIVYNNFPWPEAITEKNRLNVEAAAQQVLDTRAKFPDTSLADLYHPNTMPPALVKAHQQLDKAVDQCYRSQPFTTEAKRIEYLFELYDKYTAGLFPTEKKPRKKTK